MSEMFLENPSVVAEIGAVTVRETLHKLMAVVAGALLVLGLSGCGEKPSTNASGAALYEHYCADCHGDDGNGTFLKGIPSVVKSERSSSSILNLIHKGSTRKVTGRKQMPAMPELSGEQASRLLAHLQKLKQQAAAKPSR